MRNPDAVIELHEPTHRSTIRHQDVYFTFASGRLAYDCATCQAKCCRGHGYLVTIGKELEAQMGMRRGLPLFLERPAQDNSRQHLVTNCAPGCFFLSDDGRCDIHAQRGYDAKPETCRLFPFNNIRRIGKHLVVAPHAWLCPLEIAPENVVREESAHDSLLDAMGAQGISARIPTCSTGSEDVEQVIARERNVVALSEQYLESRDLFPFLRELAWLDMTERPGGFEHAESSFEKITHFAGQLLDVPQRPDLGNDPLLVRNMVAITPFLRAQLIFQSVGDEGRPMDMEIHRDRIPQALLALYLFAESARRVGMRTVTFQTLSKLFRDFRPLVTLVSNLDLPMAWSKGSRIELPDLRDSMQRSAFVKLAKSLLPGQQRNRRADLGQILLDHAPNDAKERALFIKDVARKVAGRLVHVDHEPTTPHASGAKSRVRNAMQRWMFKNLDESVLRAAYTRVQGAPVP